MNITIRDATIDDAAAIAKVNIASWQSTYRGLIGDATLDAMRFEDYLKKWNSILSLPQNENVCFVAESDKEGIIGYFLCGEKQFEKYSFEGELFAIYLLKEYQGQGIGKRLFLKSVEELKHRGIHSFLLFVLSSNTGSRKFYESFEPDFIAKEIITIDNKQYSDTCYGWSDIRSIS